MCALCGGSTGAGRTLAAAMALDCGELMPRIWGAVFWMGSDAGVGCIATDVACLREVRGASCSARATVAAGVGMSPAMTG